MLVLSRPVILLLSGLLLLTISIAVLNTLVPLWLFRDQLPVWYAGTVASAYFIGNLIGTLIAGRTIHYFGFNHSYYLACGLFIIATLGLLLPMHFYFWLFCRLLAGIAAALVWVIVESALLRLGTISNRGILLAAYMVVYYFGTVLGQLAITVMPTERSLMLPIMGLLIIVAILPLLFARFVRPTDEPCTAIWSMLTLPSVRLGVYGCILSGIVLGSLYGLLPIYLAHRGYSDTTVGYWMAFMIGAGILVQWPVGWLADYFGRLMLLRAQILMIIIACLLILEESKLMIALFMLGAGVLTLYPVAMAWACERVSCAQVIAMNQSLLLSYTVGSLLGPTLISLLMQYYSDQFLFVMIAIVSSFYLLLLISKRSRLLPPVTSAESLCNNKSLL